MITIAHKFVENIPDRLEEGTIYISIEYAIAVHKCPCGCGLDVVTPFSPAEWSLTFDGETVSLFPSIGNWSFPCKSHYYIRNGRIDWAFKFSDARIAAVRRKDDAARVEYYESDRSMQGGPKKPTR